MAKYRGLKDDRFVNPYNFIPLEKGCSREIGYREARAAGDLSGWIDITLETLTPLFIPNTSDNDTWRKRTRDEKPKVIHSYDFFSHTDLGKGQHAGGDGPALAQPVIPGSEIRGMIRSAFEAVTNSCISTTDDRQVLYKRTTVAGKPGRLEKVGGTWRVIPCKRYGVSISSNRYDRNNYSDRIRDFEEGQTVYFKEGGVYKTYFHFVEDPTTEKREKGAGYLSGWFHHGEPFGNKKHHESIFVRSGGDPVPVGDRDVENFRENLRLYRDKSVNIHKRKGDHKGYPRMREDLENQLVYYQEIEADGKRFVYLSPAAIGREVFSNRLKDLIGTYSPCEDPDALCPACRLFGLVSGKGAAASRVRFSDALMQETGDARELYDEPVFLPELASPKPSATEFYLNRPKADLWNYDYAITWKGNTPKTVPGYLATIRGRKFYWHSRIRRAPHIEDGKASERNVFVRPLKGGKRFRSRVFFNRISEAELRRLLWVLTIGTSPDHAHKLGMGKPIGLGSVRLDVADIVVRHITADDENATIRYTLSHHTAEEYGIRAMTEADLGCGTETLRDFRRITDFANPPENVEYPRNADAQQTYEWFMANKTSKGTGIAHVIDQELAHIESPEQHRYENDHKPRDKGFQGKRGSRTAQRGRAVPSLDHAPTRPSGREHARGDSTEQAGIAIHGMRGSVRFFDRGKKYGYIAPEDGTPDVKILVPGFRSGQRVIFDVKEGARIAINIRKDKG
jgi:CRISPR-associated protein (TIGR03986 family)